ncbi:MAG TPA: hypothetical protein VHJ18_13535 [Streptosporangiaceae bacterium]|jgi:hypothetical protein|nr:hypothetical protein [Streptosporangiaceae bacterium]
MPAQREHVQITGAGQYRAARLDLLARERADQVADAVAASGES